MNHLKVLRKALRQLARQGGALPRDEAADPAAAATAPGTAPPGGFPDVPRPGARRQAVLKGRGAAGMLLAAATMGAPGPAAAGHRGAGLAAIPLPPGVTEERVVYKQTARGPLALHVYQPAGAVPPGGRPCMVFFHGGGWKHGSPNQFRAFGAMLAQHGVIGMSAEYRLMAGDERLIPTEAIEDARSALRYVHAHAARLGCSPARIGAGGGSAGAHLAMMTAMKSPVEDPGDDLSVPARPDALIVLNGPMNFDAYASPVPVPERRLFAPYYQVDRHFPPMLVMHGTRDRVIPFEQVEAFQRKALGLGVDVKVVAFPGRGHGFFNRGKGHPGDWDRVAAEMLAFLRHLGWI